VDTVDVVGVALDRGVQRFTLELIDGLIPATVHNTGRYEEFG
jgi:hypothetical protein